MSEIITIADQLTPIVDRLLRAGVPLRSAMKALERKFVDVALVRSGGNVTRAARMLGVHRNTVMNQRREAATMRHRRFHCALKP
jgi:DNA-binding NtrC family response regulator